MSKVDWASQLRVTQPSGPSGTVAEELARILSLPVIPESTPRCPDREAYQRTLILPTAAAAGFKLRDIQLDAIWTYETLGGVVGPIGVGWGKALITMGCAIRGMKQRGNYRAVIMIPSNCYSQYTTRQLPEARGQLNFQGIAINLVEGTARQRMAVARRPGPGIWIYSYSSLSSPTGYDELKAIGGTLYVLDEAHSLANPNSARTKRFQTVMRELERDGAVEKARELIPTGVIERLEVVPLSGTLTKKGVGDYAHLAAKALGQMSPVPVREAAVTVFASALDARPASAGPLNQQETRVLGAYTDWATGCGFDCTKDEQGGGTAVALTAQEEIRRAYMYRLNSAPGVVATSDQGVDSSLLLRWVEPKRPDSPGSQLMAKLMRDVVTKQITPSGDAIDYSMHQFKWLWELSSGFYNNLVWPDIETVARQYPGKYGRSITNAEAEALLEQALKHHRLLQTYHRELRSFLESHHLPGCDTPMLVAQEILRQDEGHQPKFKIDSSVIISYLDQRKEGHHVYPDLPSRFSTPIRVCDYKIQAAADWAHAHVKTGGLLWYHHPEIGRWLCEELIRRGIPHTFAPAGENERAFASGLVVCSYAHGTGKNMQHQCHNLMVELRREASTMEQTLGRTHRSGQQADTVLADLLIGNGFDLALFNGTLTDADYIQSTMGQRQRLCYADYDPVVPPVSPRLQLKLGIIKNVTSPTNLRQWEAITPLDLQDVADLFRPVAYGKR